MNEFIGTWAFTADHLAMDWVLLTLLIAATFVIARVHDLLAAAVMLGIFSLLMALLYLLFDAPDVALTEAAVGAGISTLLFLGTLAFTGREQRRTPFVRKVVPLLVVTVVGGALIYASQDLPAFTSADAPIHRHVAPYYLEHMQEDIGIANHVTAILGSYRGFDTLGEVAVIFTAAVGIAALLMNAPQLRTTPQPPPPPLPAAEEKPSPGKRRKASARTREEGGTSS